MAINDYAGIFLFLKQGLKIRKNDKGPLRYTELDRRPRTNQQSVKGDYHRPFGQASVL